MREKFVTTKSAKINKIEAARRIAPFGSQPDR